MDSKQKLINVNTTAGMMGVSVRALWRLRDSGKMPAPIMIGARLIRWRESDITAWIQSGCPDVRRTGWTAPATTNGGGCACKGGGR